MSWHKSIERVQSLRTDKDEPTDHKFYDSDESTPAEASPKGEDYCPKYPDFFIPAPSSPKASKLESKIGSGEAQKNDQEVEGQPKLVEEVKEGTFKVPRSVPKVVKPRVHALTKRMDG